MIRTRALRRVIGWVIGWVMGAVVVTSVVLWYLKRNPLPDEIRIATAARGGLYYRFADALSPYLQRQGSRPVVLLETEGSCDNRIRLLNDDADLAILQSGSVEMDDLVALAPLYYDVVFVVARKGRGVDQVRDLAGKSVAIGPPGSGMRASAIQVLDQYGIDFATLRHTDRYFHDLITDGALDAAIVTTGLTSPDLETLMSTDRFELIPILDAEAFSVRHPSFKPFVIPRGLYEEGLPVPPEDLMTVATTAFLAARADVSPRLVRAAIEALYENDIRAQVPTLIASAEAVHWPQAPLHPVARDYFDPYGGIAVLAQLMESVTAVKELLFAFGAGLYLLWNRWRRMRRRERDRELTLLKEQLDALLGETVRIERAQMDTCDAGTLTGYLDDVTRIKLRALEELIHEELRSDPAFLIFMVQCDALTDKIRSKISMLPVATRSEPTEQ